MSTLTERESRQTTRLSPQARMNGMMVVATAQALQLLRFLGAGRFRKPSAFVGMVAAALCGAIASTVAVAAAWLIIGAIWGKELSSVGNHIGL